MCIIKERKKERPNVCITQNVQQSSKAKMEQKTTYFTIKAIPWLR